MYIEKLKSLSLDNMYSRICFNIIGNALNRECTEGYFEKHHILPKSFELGGETDPNNIVKLTSREHYIVHRLLSKIIIDKVLSRKMYFAVWRMSNSKMHLSNSRQYEYAKNNCSIHMKEHMKELWKDNEYRYKMYKSREWYYKDEDRQKEHSECIKEMMKDQEYKNKCIEPMRAAHKFIDHSSSEWLNRSIQSEESKEKSAATCKSEAHRENCRDRELAKGKEKLSEIGKARRKRQIELAIIEHGSIEAANKAMGDKMRGRVKVKHPETGIVKTVRNPEDFLLLGWVLVKKIKIGTNNAHYI